MTEKFIIDRFEQDFAVVERENGEMIDISVMYLPENVKAGDVIILTENGYVSHEKSTAERRKSNIERLKKILKGGAE